MLAKIKYRQWRVFGCSLRGWFKTLVSAAWKRQHEESSKSFLLTGVRREKKKNKWHYPGLDKSHYSLTKQHWALTSGLSWYRFPPSEAKRPRWCWCFQSRRESWLSAERRKWESKEIWNSRFYKCHCDWLSCQHKLMPHSLSNNYSAQRLILLFGLQIVESDICIQYIFAPFCNCLYGIVDVAKCLCCFSEEKQQFSNENWHQTKKKN